jgi:SpoVK/Ycf46/Vps4 family AAA+-type ATPase
MREYEAIAILTTNVTKNMDEAFTRKRQFTVEFPFPDEEQRFRIWESMLPE